jgi:stage V sporulation protein B
MSTHLAPPIQDSTPNGVGSGARGKITFRKLRLLLLHYRALAYQSDFIRAVAETYATQITLIVVGLATTVIVTRSLGPAGRGLYSVAMAVGFLGVQFGNWGFPASNTYYLAKDRSLLPRLLGNSLLLSFLIGGIGSATFGLAFYLYPRWEPVHGLLLVLGLAWIPVGLAYLLLGRLLLGLHEVRSFNKLELMNRFCALILIAAAIFLRRINPEAILAANLLGLVLSCAWALSKLLSMVEEFPWPSSKLLREHCGVGMRAYVITAFSLLLIRADLLMVKYLLGPEQAGYYSIVSTIADYLLMLPGVIALILFPRLSAITDVKEKLRKAKKAALGTAVALLPLLIVATVSSRLVVRVLFGKTFLPAADAFTWLAPGIFTLGIEVVIVQFLNSVGYPKIVVWIWCLSVILNVTLNFWAIPHYGIKGASAMSSLSYSLTLLAISAVIWRGSYPTPKEAVAETFVEIPSH